MNYLTMTSTKSFPAGFNKNEDNPYVSVVKTLSGFKHIKDLPILKRLENLVIGQ